MALLAPSGQILLPVATRCGARVIVIDNYDSFTFNLVQYLLELGAVVEIYRNDAVDAAAVFAAQPSHVVLSPGPGSPRESGVCRAICAQALSAGIPLLGVCLGHQTLCAVLGARVERAPRVMHGKVSRISHDGSGVFEGLPSPFEATRYHSLVAVESTLPRSLRATAWAESGDLMAVAHSELPIYGVQFHPESIMTEHGHALLRNFLRRRGRPAVA